MTEGTVSLPISRRLVNATVASAVRAKGQWSVPVPLENQVYSYVADLTLGTPGQVSKALIDTGSSDLWVFTSNAVKQYGFNPEKSSTYKLKQKDGFSIQYVSGSAQGDWVTDNVTLGGTTVKNQQFATVDDQSADQEETIGVFGIARTVGESVNSEAEVYDNYPVSLKKQGLIKVVAYSLFLDDLQAATGSVLFGGVDKSKYTGPLKALPFTAPDRLSVEFSVGGFAYKDGVLDSGTSLTYLPQEAFDAITKSHDWDLQYDQSGGIYYVTSEPTGEGVTYTFGGLEITVPIEELFLKQSTSQWVLTILTTASSQNIILIGDSTLRSLYVVYDLENNQAAIAKANYDTTSSNVVAITGSTIPGAQ